MSERLAELLERIETLLDAGESRAAELRALLAELPAEEVEELFGEMDSEGRQEVLRLLEPEMAAEVLGGVDEHIQEEIADALSDRELAEIVEEMDSDEAADTIRHLEPEEQERVLDLLEDETEEEVRGLLQHEEDTAGDLMMAELAAINQDALVAEAIEELRAKADEVKQLYSVYLVDDARKLQGVLSLRDMVLARPGMPLKALMEPVPVTVTPSMDQEEVAALFRKYDIVSAPVVDAEGVLVGRITVDDVLDVIDEEAWEDLSRAVGVDALSFHARSLFSISAGRLPWLILGLFGGLLSARILAHFQLALSQVLTLAFFVPVITALGGNIGIQSATIMVRGLATGEVKSRSLRLRMLRELTVSGLNGLVIGVISYFVVWIWLGDRGLGTVVSLSMLSVVVWATTTGTLVPIVLSAIGVDPAYATGPFVTTTNDVVDLTIYMLIAHQLSFLLT
ncbi:MAG: magnesium transporter [Candidatus Krumholzibacteriia bacterium]|nr:magnesium transporter [bacterium]MCB9512727.1 magnesium transporter [Candidatus Latescibacterota bacterium]MCB9516811.1 magnesium transporter [Candidatus Latescibacterota bacterium]